MKKVSLTQRCLFVTLIVLYYSKLNLTYLAYWFDYVLVTD